MSAEDDLTHLSDEENVQKRTWKDNHLSKGGVLESDGADSADMNSFYSSQGSASTSNRAGNVFFYLASRYLPLLTTIGTTYSLCRF